MIRPSPNAVFYSVLALLPIALALPRLFTGPWYLTHSPAGARLLEGLPISWESTYYLMQFTRFLGDVQPEAAPFTSIHYRTWPNLFLATSLYAVLGSSFWAMAAVDWLFWVLGAIAGDRVARRLGAGRLAAALAAVMIVGAPIFACSVWRVDLRLGNSATMAIGLWAAFALVDDERHPLRLAAKLGLMLLLLGLNYQYQFIIGPMLLVLLLASPTLTKRQAIAVLAGAAATYLFSNSLLRWALDVAVGVPGGEPSTIVAAAEEMLAARLSAMRSLADLLPLLPSWYHLELTAQAYHPVVLAACVAGLFLLTPLARWLAVVATLATFATVSFYGYPWVAMSAYPIFYAGAAMTCVVAGRTLARVITRLVPAAKVVALNRRDPDAVAVGLACVLLTLTNLDLVGDSTFYLRWWNFWDRVTF